MKFGLNVIHAWGARNNVDNVSNFILDLAIAADESGWDGFFLWDHLIFQWVVPMADPWTVLSCIAGRTKNLKLGTLVTPLPRRRPHIIAKQLATIDQLSKGRSVLGVGLGALDIDYVKFGEEFNHRLLAEKADEALEVITGLWSGKEFSYHGKHYTIDEVTFHPKPVQNPRIPVWIGGVSKGALRRASRFEGWAMDGPNPSAGDFDTGGLSFEQVAESVDIIRKYGGNNEPFDVVYSFEFPDEENVLRESISEAESAGVTWMLNSIFGLRCDREEAFDIVKKGPPSN